MALRLDFEIEEVRRSLGFFSSHTGSELILIERLRDFRLILVVDSCSTLDVELGDNSRLVNSRSTLGINSRSILGVSL